MPTSKVLNAKVPTSKVPTSKVPTSKVPKAKVVTIRLPTYVHVAEYQIVNQPNCLPVNLSNL
jgi:hypothetical protein